MKLVRLAIEKTVVRLELYVTDTGIWSVISAKTPFQNNTESAGFETIEEAEAYAIDLAERYLADVLYIEDYT